MTDLLWLLQGNMRNQSDLRQMRSALESIDQAYSLVALTPFVDEIPAFEAPPETAAIVCWGPSFVPRALKHHRLSPGIWYDHDNFRWSVFRDHWTDLMFAPDGQVKSFADAVSGLTAKPVFMRPDEDTKSFEGSLYAADKTPRLQAAFDEDIPVVIAAPQLVEHEWRFVIVDGEIVEATSYRIAGLPSISGSIPEMAIDLAITAIAKWCPAAVFCLDVGYGDGRYGIIEANCFNASRLYGADFVKIVSAVNAALIASP